jgi:hypothetical protein
LNVPGLASSKVVKPDPTTEKVETKRYKRNNKQINTWFLQNPKADNRSAGQ